MARSVSWTAAVRDGPGGALLDLEVVPGAKGGDRFPDGYNPWRRRLGARVAAPPEEGRANAALLALVAATLGVGAAQVTLASGGAQRLKTLAVSGMSAAQVVERLEGRL